jgi:hypothetical protein
MIDRFYICLGIFLVGWFSGLLFAIVRIIWFPHGLFAAVF